MLLKDISFGDVDAKNEILKQKRSGDRDFFLSYSIPQKIDINEYMNGKTLYSWPQRDRENSATTLSA